MDSEENRSGRMVGEGSNGNVWGAQTVVRTTD